MNLDEGWLRGAQLLVVDDEPANIALIEQMLSRAGFSRIRSTTDPRCFEAMFLEERPDMVLLDLHMPHLDGLELLRELKTLRRPEEYLPVLMLSADRSSRARTDALGAGAVDFLTKPLDAAEVGLRVLNYLEARRLHLRLDGQRRHLDELVRQRTSELERAHMATLRRLNLVNEFRDDATTEHTRRVGTAASRLTRVAGGSEELSVLIEHAAPLHDLGKVGVPDAVLLKPGRLSPEEFELIRAHPIIGAQIIGDTTSEVLNIARVIAQTHHERWNGEGYPSGLRGEEIPLPGRIVAVCDVFDALTHERPYKQAWTTDEAVEELRAQRGAFFDSDLVDVFIADVLPDLPWVADRPVRQPALDSVGSFPLESEPDRREMTADQWLTPGATVGNNAEAVAAAGATNGWARGNRR